MPTATNITFHKDCEWDTYCKLPGHSFSSLKNEQRPFVESEGSRIGKAVHQYILKPLEYDWSMPEIVIPIARKLIDFVSPSVLKQMVPECGITATFTSDGFELPWRGMPDLYLRNVLVIDFKVFKSGSVAQFIKNYGSDNQVRGYMLPVSAPVGLIVGYNRTKREVDVATILPDGHWWDNIVKTKGELCACM